MLAGREKAARRRFRLRGGGFRAVAALAAALATSGLGALPAAAAPSTFRATATVDSTTYLQRFAGTGTTGTSAAGLAASSAIGAAPGVAFDTSGNAYVLDPTNNRVLQITTAGVLSYFAGNGSSGSPAAGVATASPLTLSASNPAITVDTSGNVFVVSGGTQVVKITSGGTLSLLTGSFTSATGLTAVGTDVYVADNGANRVLKYTGGSGSAANYAGTGSAGYPTTSATAATSAAITPWNLTADSSGNLFVTDKLHCVLAKVTTTPQMSTIAGTGACGAPVAGTATSSPLYAPAGVAVDTAGNVFVANSTGCTIVEVIGTALSLADGTGSCAATGYGVTTGTSNPLYSVSGLAMSPSDVLYLADPSSFSVGRFVTAPPAPTGLVATAGNGQASLSFTAPSGNVTGYQYQANGGSWSTLTTSGTTTVTGTVPNLNNGTTYSIAVRTVDGSFSSAASATATATPPAWTAAQFAGTGSTGTPAANSTATSVTLGSPGAVAFDSAGNAYIADSAANVVEKVTPAGVLSIFAGTGGSGAPSAGTATSVTTPAPSGVAVDRSGNVYVSLGANHYVVKIDTGNNLTFFAGTGSSGTPAANASATAVTLNTPGALSTDPAGSVYVADTGANMVLKVTSTGALSILAGTGPAGTGTPVPGAAASSPITPSALAVDLGGNVYVTDATHHEVARVTLGGTLSIVAGTGASGTPVSGATATATPFTSPTGVAIGNSHELYVYDSGPHKIYKVVVGGVLGVVAGTGTTGAPTYGSLAMSSAVKAAPGLAVSPDGLLYVANSTNYTVDKYTVTVPTAPLTFTATPGNGSATLNFTTPTTPGGSLTGYDYSTDNGTTWSNLNNGSSQTGTVTGLTNGQTYSVRVRADNASGTPGTGIPSTWSRVTPTNSQLLRFAGVSGTPAAPIAGPVGASPLSSPRQLTFDAAGNAYIADTGNNVIEKVATDGKLTVIAGTGVAGALVAGAATSSTLSAPSGVAVASDGTIYFTSTYSGTGQIGKIVSGTLSIVSGTSLVDPTSLVLDTSNNLYVSDYAGYKVYKITSGGTVTTYAGTGSSGTPAAGVATAVAVHPYGLGIDATNNVYIADYTGNVIEKVDTAGTPNLTIALGTGTAANPTTGTASASALLNPTAVAVDSSGNMYVFNGGNNTVIEVSGGTLSVVAGNLASGAPTYDGPATGTPLQAGRALAVTSDGVPYLSDTGNHTIDVIGRLPGAPTALSATGGNYSAALQFTAPVDTGSAPIRGYRASTDNGVTWQAIPTTGSGPLTARLFALSGGVTYQVRVRAVTSAGAGTASSSVGVTPGGGPGGPPVSLAAPAGVTAQPGISTLTVDWNPVEGATGYSVTASPGQSSCTTGASTTHCVLGVTAGVTYTVTVMATAGSTVSPASTPAGPVTALAAPVPPTVPDSVPDTLTTDKGQVEAATPGQNLTLVGTGFAAHSTVRVLLYSSPIDLGNGTVGSDGKLSLPVTLPADLPTGSHTLLASGVDPSGSVRQMALPITVTGATPPNTGGTTGRPRVWAAAHLVLTGSQVTADCALSTGVLDRCAVTLRAMVDHRWVTVGSGTNSGHPAGTLEVGITVTASGQAWAARLGGLPVTLSAQLTPQALAHPVTATAVATLLAARILPPRPVFFAPGSAVLGRTEVAYLRAVRAELAGARTMSCVANTTTSGTGESLALGKRRAQAVCAYLNSGHRASVAILGRAAPRGMGAYGRRVDIALGY